MIRKLIPDACLPLQIPKVEPVKLVISGPSGVGKDAIVKALQAARPDLHFVITATSRCAFCHTRKLVAARSGFPGVRLLCAW